MSDIKPLLLASMAAHQRAKQRIGGQMLNGHRVNAFVQKPADWAVRLEALNLLGQAEALDPKHEDPAWQECQAQFETAKQIPVRMPFWEALMGFYEAQVG